jgi:hypothetical protein
VPGNRKIRDIQRFLTLARELDVKVMVYTTPINFQSGERFAGPAFRSQVDANIAVLNGSFEPYMDTNHARVFDWSRSIDSALFFGEDHATEHLNQNGRQEISGRVTKGVRGFLECKKKEEE